MASDHLLQELQQTVPPPQLLSIAVVIVAIVVATALLRPVFFSSKKKLSWPPPPSPWQIPLIGNLHQLGVLPHRSLRDLSKRHGPLMFLRLGRVPAIVVSSPGLAEEVMKTQDLAFASRPSPSTAKILLYGPRDVGLAPYGEHWRRMRKICVLQMLSRNRVGSFSPVRNEEVQLMVRRIRESSVGGGDRELTVNLTEILVDLANNVVCRAAFGKTYADDEVAAEKLQGMLREYITVIGSFPIGDYVPWLSWVDTVSGLNARVRRIFKDFDAFLEKIIDNHGSDPEGGGGRRGSGSSSKSPIDFVDVLLSVDVNDDGAATTGGGTTLERDCIKALILDMFLAGTETSSSVLEWTMAELIRHPNELIKAQEDVRKAVDATGRGGVEEGDLNHMSYMKAVIGESMRLHPPLPLLVTRESITDAVLQGYHVPAKTTVLINAWAIARDPDVWEAPEEFRPERFVGGGGGIDFMGGQDFRIVPFGSGRRGCPGVLFGMSTVELALANLLYHFDWGLLQGQEPTEMAMDEAPGMAVRRKSSLTVVASARTP